MRKTRKLTIWKFLTAYGFIDKSWTLFKKEKPKGRKYIKAGKLLEIYRRKHNVARETF